MLAEWTPARALVAEILGRFLRTYMRAGIGYSALIACPILG